MVITFDVFCSRRFRWFRKNPDKKSMRAYHPVRKPPVTAEPTDSTQSTLTIDQQQQQSYETLFFFLLLLLFLIPWAADVCPVVVNTDRSRSASEFIFCTFCIYWAIQAGLLTPLTFARHRLSPLATFTSGAYFLHNGRRWQWICEFYTANFKGIFGGP